MAELSKFGQKNLARVEAKIQQKFMQKQMKTMSNLALRQSARDLNRYSRYKTEYEDGLRVGQIQLKDGFDRGGISDHLVDTMVERGMISEAEMYFPEKRQRIMDKAGLRTVKKLFGFIFRAT